MYAIAVCLCCTVGFGWTLPFVSAQQIENSTNCSDILYLEQPPTSGVSCDPYNSTMRLRCSLYHSKGLGNLTIEWYRSGENHSQTPELLSDPASDTFLMAELLIDGTNISNLSASTYWCQAGRGEGGEVLGYVRSAMFKLMPREAYRNYSSCDGEILSQQNVTSLCPGHGTIELEPQLSVTLLVTSTVFGVLFVTSTLLLCIICCLLKSKNKLKRKKESKPVLEELSEGLSVESSSSQTASTQHLEAQLVCTSAGDAQPLQCDAENSASYEDVTEPMNITIPVKAVTTQTHPSSLTTASNLLPHSMIEVLPTAEVDYTHYHALDADMKDDEHEYTDRRLPPPVAPRKPVLKSRSPVPSRVALATNKLDGPPSVFLEQNAKLPPTPREMDRNKKGGMCGPPHSPSSVKSRVPPPLGPDSAVSGGSLLNS